MLREAQRTSGDEWRRRGSPVGTLVVSDVEGNDA